jgi:hypothetical protein
MGCYSASIPPHFFGIHQALCVPERLQKPDIPFCFHLTRVGPAPCPRRVTHELTDAGSNEFDPRMCTQVFDKERKGLARRSGTWHWQVPVQYVGFAFQKPRDNSNGKRRHHAFTVKAPIAGLSSKCI